MAKNGKKIRIFSALEVANMCGVVNQTAINWIKHDYLKAFTTPGGQYRVYADDLADFLKSRGMRMPEDLQQVLREQNGGITTILIVEDEEELNNLLTRFFKKKENGFEVYQAYDGFEAGRIVAEKKPELVILDIDLPGIDGHKLCKRIKEDSSLRNPVVISISGLDNPEEKERILSEGAEAFFPKPLDFDKIYEAILEYKKTE